MKKRLRILALYRTAELKKNIAGILDNENAFYTTYAFLDSGDICQLSARILILSFLKRPWTKTDIQQ